MADRFRLIHFKSTDSERMVPHRTSSFRPPEEASSKAPSFPAPDLPETFSSQTALGQVKTDLNHTDPRIRVLALQYVEKREPPVAIPLLQEALSDRDPEVRLQAVRSLIKFRDPGVNPLLRKCLRDVHPGVRIGALRGIFQFGEGVDLNILLQFLSDESPWVRRKLATLLGWTRLEGVLPILTEMSKDEDSRVRKAALFSLMTLYPEEGRERLFEACKEEDPDIRNWARKTLERWVARSMVR